MSKDCTRIMFRRDEGSVMMAGAEARGRKILVAVDDGEESMHALSWCLKNVVSDGTGKDTLILLYVRPPQVVYGAHDGTGYLFSSDIIASMEISVADAVIQKAKRACKNLQNVKVDTGIEYGDPREVICNMVEKLRVDILVMGSHGYGLLKRTLLGSVSSHCAQNVKCPVLIVKKPK